MVDILKLLIMYCYRKVKNTILNITQFSFKLVQVSYKIKTCNNSRNDLFTYRLLIFITKFARLLKFVAQIY